MILTRLGQALQTQRRASLNDLALSVNATPEAVRDMLAVLERKGRIRRLSSGSVCGGGCAKCDSTRQELYEWCATGS